MLKLDDHPYSPTVLARIVYLTGVCESGEAAALALQEAAEIQVAASTAQKLATQVGAELRAERDEQADAYDQQPLPRRPREVSPPPQLATVYLDGGRIRTRVDGGGHGVHQPHWRETKNAAFHRMQTASHACDPQPELPDCFRNQAYVAKLVSGLKKAQNAAAELMERDAEIAEPEEETIRKT